MRDNWCTWLEERSQGVVSEDLPDARGIASDVVVERRLAKLERRQGRDRLGIERDAEPGLAGDGHLAALDRDRLVEHVADLERVVGVAGKGVVGRGRDEVRVGGRRDAELGPAADDAPLAGRGGDRADL